MGGNRSNHPRLSFAEFEAALRAVGDDVGRIPTWGQWRDRYGNRFYNLIQAEGGFVAIRRKVYPDADPDEYPKVGDWKYTHVANYATKERIISQIRAFYKRTGRTPMADDFVKANDMVTPPTIISRFGTLNKARLAAGVPAVIPIFGEKSMTVSPEQYVKYQQRRDSSKSREATLRFEALKRRRQHNGQ